jgi:hypothetical protein
MFSRCEDFGQPDHSQGETSLLALRILASNATSTVERRHPASEMPG